MILSLVFFVPLLFLALQTPRTTEAVGSFAPFGGKVLAWLPTAPGCTAVTAAISTATLGAINLTVEQLQVGPPKAGVFGLVRINGFVPPGLTTIYNQGEVYRIPGAQVLGTTVNLCSLVSEAACNRGVSDPTAKAICAGVGSSIVGHLCGTLAGACPLTKIIHKIGSARPGP